MAKATSGSSGAFTYDFGILISQSTVGRLARTAQATLTLAGAYYALNRQATEYVSTLRKQQMFFGGQVATMKAISDAQERIVQGTARFDVTDQLEGMNNLMRVGVDARKEFEWTEKAAHAMGVSYSQFSNAIAQGIAGNMSGLVEMGLLTERSTRMFEKYQGNTIMRQQAILNFVKQHKGLQTAIVNDFGTIKDQMLRLKGTWKSFLTSILGQPNDPSSFYGQVREAIKGVADAFARNFEDIKRYGFQIGQVLGWVVRQVGHLVVWLGRQVKSVLQKIWSVGENYKEAVRSFVVWLEFEKLYILDFFKKHEKAIMFVVKAFLIYKAAKWALKLPLSIINSIVNGAKAFWAFGKAAVTACSNAILWVRVAALNVGAWLHRAGVAVWGFARTIGGVVKVVGVYVSKGVAFMWKALVGFGRMLIAGVRALNALIFGSNPIGWIILGISAIIAGLIALYKHCEPFRRWVDNLWAKTKAFFKDVWEGIKGIGKWFVRVFEGFHAVILKVKGWFADMWNSFKDTAVGRFVTDYIVTPIGNLIKAIKTTILALVDKLVSLWNGLKEFLKKAGDENAPAKAPTSLFPGLYQPLNPGNPSKYMTDSEGNPILAQATVPNPAATIPDAAVGRTAYNTTNNNVTWGPGAIQIYASPGMDEQAVAELVLRKIDDRERSKNMRGGLA